MNKDQIIAEIKRTAQQNSGVPLSIDRFRDQTGIEKKDWYGIYWAKWSVAQMEAGYVPNQFSTPAFEEEWIIKKVIDLIRELGHFPTKPEFKLKRQKDTCFPTDTTLRNRLGKKLEMASKVAAYCQTKPDYSDVNKICSSIISAGHQQSSTRSNTEISNTTSGHVYLLRHNEEYKIGKSIDVTRRYKEIKVQMPHKMEELHVIETDDPSGIEAYWHNRFRDKRLEGEWFKLNADDIKAFKRRKYM
jgi:Meiotically up-regulated gene 113